MRFVATIIGLLCVGPAAVAAAPPQTDLVFDCLKRRNITDEQRITVCSKAIKAAPDHAELYKWRGASYRIVKKYRRALADYDGAIRVDSQDWEAFNGRGQVYFDSGRYDSAADDFGKAAELNPKSPFPWRNRCEVYVIQNKADAAIADCDASLKLEIAPDVLRLRGIAQLKLGKYESALGDLNSALKAAPDDADALYARGLAKRKMGDGIGARADIAAAISRDPKVAKKFEKYEVEER